MIVDNVFNVINEQKEGFYTKREFSRDYLGKCGSYYSSTKTKEVDVSKTALINLWHALRKDVERYDTVAQRANDSWMKSNLLQRKQEFEVLSKGVLEALITKDTPLKQETRV